MQITAEGEEICQITEGTVLCSCSGRSRPAAIGDVSWQVVVFGIRFRTSTTAGSSGRAVRPETLDAGYAPAWVQAWVVQGGDGDGNGDGTSYSGPGPSQNSNQSSWSGWAPPGQWTAAEPGWVNGPLQPGAATGIALMALYNRNTTPPGYEYQWWVSAITLDQEP